MKLILDIPDNKAAFFMELLKNFTFIKAKTISPAKAELIEDIKQAVDNLNLVKQGKMQARSAKDLLEFIN